MKSTTFVAILLTFLTLLLVLAASIVFLWQGRQEAITTIDRLQEEKSALQGTATIVRSYLTAREEGVATARAGGTVVAQGLAQAQATTVTLEETRAGLASERAALATRAAEQETALSTPPSVAIISPRPDDALLPGQQVLVAGSHPRGLSGLQLSLAANRILFPGAGETFAVFSYTLPLSLPAGLYTATATITATNHLTATTSVPFRVTVGAESGNAEGNRLPPAPISAVLSRYPVFFKPAAIPFIVKKIARSSA